MTDQQDNRKAGAGLRQKPWRRRRSGASNSVTKALVPAIHPSTTFERDKDGGYSSGRGYTRPHNPTYDEVEELLIRSRVARQVFCSPWPPSPCYPATTS